MQGGKICLDDDILDLFLLNEGTEQGLGKMLIVKPQTLSEVALWVQIDHERSNSHLGQTEPIRGREAALSCPSFKVEKELLSRRFHRRRDTQIVPVF